MTDQAAPGQIPPGFKLRYTLQGHVGGILRIAWSRNGSLLASGGNDGRIGLWNVKAGQLLRLFKGYVGSIFCLVWSPNGELLACSGGNKDVNIFNPVTGQLCQSLDEHKVKEDVDMLRSSKRRGLKWTEHAEEEIRGFNQKYTLWSV